MAQATARCRNQANCDLALRGELIEIPQDGRCPECRQPLQAEARATSATDAARRQRVMMLSIGGGVVALAIAGIAAFALQNSGSEPAKPTEMDMASMTASDSKVELPAAVAPKPEPVVEPAPAPVPEPAPAARPEPTGPSLETQQHVKQGMMFVSLAKQNPKTRSENIKNALIEFDHAVKQEEQEGRCYASGYMNRGIAYWQDKKLNLAEKDLVKASECDPNDPITFYNLASYYSATNKADLAIAPLDQALELGFKDCDVLRKDSDLNNLRKLEEFRQTLEKHQLFCIR